MLMRCIVRTAVIFLFSLKEFVFPLKNIYEFELSVLYEAIHIEMIPLYEVLNDSLVVDFFRTVLHNHMIKNAKRFVLNTLHIQV